MIANFSLVCHCVGSNSFVHVYNYVLPVYKTCRGHLSIANTRVLSSHLQNITITDHNKANLTPHMKRVHVILIKSFFYHK